MVDGLIDNKWQCLLQPIPENSNFRFTNFDNYSKKIMSKKTQNAKENKVFT